MSYDWDGEAKREGGGSVADPIPATERTTLLVVRAIYERKDGTSFTSQKGDPQVFLVFQDSEGREAAQMYTLSEAAGWTIAKLVDAMDPDLLAELKRLDIHPVDFVEPEVLKTWLMTPAASGQADSRGTFFEASVRYEPRKADPTKKDPRITPLRREPEPDDDIPM